MKMRLAAGLIDALFVGLALALFAGISHLINPAMLQGESAAPVLGILFSAMLLFYWIFFLRFVGSTAGMTLLHLRVLNFDCEAPSHQQRRNRAAGTVLSAAALGIGFVWALVDEQGLTWHDRISKTFVAVAY